MKYIVKVSSNSTYEYQFESNSRNAKKHLAQNIGEQGGAKCEVYKKNKDGSTGEQISCAMYTCQNGGKYYNATF